MTSSHLRNLNEVDKKWQVGDGSHWRVWAVIDEIERNGLSLGRSRSTRDSGAPSGVLETDDLSKEVINILRYWGRKWAGCSGWQTLLNKKSLLHEVEESIVAIQMVIDWLEIRRIRHRRDGKNALSPVTLVDVCCGKGIFSMLASYVFRNKSSTHVSNIIMLDKQNNIDWSHISTSNEEAEDEDRPLIKTWGGCNLHDIDQVAERLQHIAPVHGQADTPLALVGIHLCKYLSPSCVGVANVLGPDKCHFLCLAPCCLPRIVTTLSKSEGTSSLTNRGEKGWNREENPTIPVRRFESHEERTARYKAKHRHDGAKRRSVATHICFLCAKADHPIHKCNLLPLDKVERINILKRAATSTPCWKCGEVGHFKAECPSTQTSSKPKLILPPTINLDISSVVNVNRSACEEKKTPFENYCELLATAIQHNVVRVLDAGLVNQSAQHDSASNHNNWNRNRKSTFIVAYS